MTATGNESRPEPAAGGHRYLLPLGEPLGHYRILRPLSFGALGEIYLAEDVRSRTRHALRVLPPGLTHDPSVVARFQEQVEILKKLHHPNILEVSSAGHSRGHHYLVMEYAESARGDWRTLEDELRETGGRIRDEDRARAIGLQIGEALQHAHGQGVIHGNLQPSTILLARGRESAGTQRGWTSKSLGGSGGSQDEGTVRVMDFGMFGVFGPLASRTKSGGGGVASPEQKEGGENSPQGDFYAMGALLYLMLTGRMPGDPFIPPSRRGAGKAWDGIIEKCLNPEPGARYADAAELLEDLRKAVRHRSLRPILVMGAVLLAAAVAAWQGPRLWRGIAADLERRAELRRQAEARQAQARVLVLEARKAFQDKNIVEADVLVRRALDLVPGLPDAQALREEIGRVGVLAEAAALRGESAQKMERLRQQAADVFWRPSVEAVESLFRDAEAVWAAADYRATLEKYRGVSSECDRLIKLAEQRQVAVKEKSRGEQARWSARRRGAERDAAALWTEAESLSRSAEEALNEGRFVNAAQDWRAAAQVYARAEQAAVTAARGRVEEERRRQTEEEQSRQRLRWPKVPEGFKVVEGEVDRSSGLPMTIEHIKTAYRLRLVPAGVFTLGSPPGEGNPDEHPARRIYLDAYWIGETPVTCGQYAWFLNDKGNQEESGVAWVNLGPAVKLGWSGNLFVPDAGYESHPVVEVSWYGAVAFARWMEGDLPTEPQWEKAAKGGRDTRWPWGDSWGPNRANTAERIAGRDRFQTYDEWLAWWEPYHRTVQVEQGAYVDTTVPVRSYPPNGYGLYDMAGNVLEWCLDYYVPDAYQALQDGQRNPPPVREGTQEKITYWRGGEQITETAECRIVRGGSWGYMADYARCAFRFKGLSTGRYSDGGFRVVVLPRP